MLDDSLRGTVHPDDDPESNYSSYDRRATRHDRPFALRCLRLLRSQGVLTISLLTCLFVLFSFISVTYIKTGGGASKSNFGCDFAFSRPHTSNRTVNRALCEIHRPETQINKEILDKLVSNAYPVDSKVTFMVVGDWGRDGWCCQRDVAWEMARAAKTINPRFVLNTGDGFYEYGLLSATEEQVSTSWRDVYLSHEDLKAVPWFSVLGNHEYRGSATAVMNVGKLDPRFVMPARYWNTTVKSTDGKTEVCVVLLDTSPMIPAYQRKGYDDVSDTMLNQPDGVSSQFAKVEEQLKWLDQTLGECASKIRVVMGHHPSYTSGSHYLEDEYFLRTHINPLFEKHKVLAYFSGHDHNLQEYWEMGKPTHYFVSAGGSKVEGAFTTADVNLRYFDQVNGFAAVEASPGGLKVSFVDFVGNVIQSVDIPTVGDIPAGR